MSEGFTSINLELKHEQTIIDENYYLRGLFKIYPSFYVNEYRKAKVEYERHKAETIKQESQT